MSTSAAPVERLGRYDVLGEIASGGMATVFLARMSGAKGFQRLVAIKRLHPHLEAEEDFVSMFLDEARLAARIHHSNCVATLEVEDQDGLYIVMEYIEGDRLLALLRHAAKSSEHIPVPITLRIALDTLAGLHAAHELTDDDGELLGLVHRDVSPQNVLLGSDGVARLTDFGIAKATARLTVTRDGQLKGKIAYMAPEQTKRVEIDRRVDVFAMGIIVWEMLTSRKLFNGESDVEVLNQLLFEPIPRPKEIVPSLPQSLDDAVMKALERDPQKRYATAAEFGDALEEVSKVFGGAANARAVAGHLQKVSGEKLARDRARATVSTDGGTPSRVQRRPTGTHEVLAQSLPRTAAPTGSSPAAGARKPTGAALPVPPALPPGMAQKRPPAIPSLPTPAAPPPPSSIAASVALVDDDEDVPTQAIVRSSIVGLQHVVEQAGEVSAKPAPKPEPEAPVAARPEPKPAAEALAPPPPPVAPPRQPTGKLPAIVGPTVVLPPEHKAAPAVGPPPTALTGDSQLTPLSVTASPEPAGRSRAPLFGGLALLAVLGMAGGWFAIRAGGNSQSAAAPPVGTLVRPVPEPAPAPVAAPPPSAPAPAPAPVAVQAPPPAPAPPPAVEPPAAPPPPPPPVAQAPAPAPAPAATGNEGAASGGTAPPPSAPAVAARGGRRGGAAGGGGATVGAAAPSGGSAAPPPPPAAPPPPPPPSRPREDNPFGNDNPYNH